jgi:hypothetical protein
MYDAELKRMRDLIRTRRYVMTLHAEDEMDADGLTIFDIESVILTGQITERQRDRQSDERKYLVSGQALAGAAVTVVVKFGATDKLVMITVFRE